MGPYTRVYAEVDLDAICHNMEAMKWNLAAGTKMIGIVKADAYGHGAAPVALAIDPYVEGYGVATAEEAYLLRSHGIRKPILILGVVHKSHYKELVRQKIRPAIFTMEQAQAFSQAAAAQGMTGAIHLALDTGMSRIGMNPDEAGADLAAAIAALPGIRVEGLFTHFARADEQDKSKTDAQFSRYLAFSELLEKRGLSIPVRHCANSAAIIDLPGTHLGYVRAGISIYGMYPSDEVDKQAVALRPAMALKSFVTYVKELAPGREISYGGTFVADRPMRVATIPVGYGDGYLRSLSGKGHVLIAGKKAPILGRICMDQMMVDVTHIPEAAEDSPVTLIGRDGTEQILVEDLARLGGGFHYEIVCNIGKRVPRVYVRMGEPVGSKDYFGDVFDGFSAKL